MNRYIEVLLGIVIFLWMIGCSSQSKPDKIITEARELLSMDADSALLTLQKINNSDDLSDSTKANYWLVLGQAHFDLNYSLSEDSLLLYAKEYYSKNNEHKTRLDDAYMLSALYLYWNNKHAEANDLLRERMQIALNESDSALLRSLYWKLAYVNNDDLYRDVEYTKKIIEYSNKDKDVSNLYKSLGVVYGILHQKDSSIWAFEKSLSLIQDTTTFYYYDIYRNYADFLNELDETEQAMHMQKKLIHQYSATDSASYALSLLSISNYYLNLNQLDSAKYYLHKSLREKPISFGEDFDFALNNIYVMQNAVLDYATTKKIKIGDIATFSNLTLGDMNRKKRILWAKTNNISLLKERNLKLEIQKKKNQNTLLCAIIVMIVILTVGYIYTNKKKKIAEAREDELDAMRRLMKEAHNKDDFFKQILLQQLGVIRLAAGTPKDQNREFLQQMARITNKDVPVDTLLIWEDLYKIIDSVYDNFHSKLIKKYDTLLIDKDVQLCCLLIADFSTKEISIVSQQSVRTIYQRKTNIRQKLGMDEKEDIVEFIVTNF